MEILVGLVVGVIVTAVYLHMTKIIPLEEEVDMLDNELKSIKLRLNLTHKSEL
jgi:uncharacterized membrane-anchored protein YhcB (DUF1043 family)